MAEYNEYAALASGWGTGQLHPSPGHNEIVDGAFCLAASSNMHCLLLMLEEWCVLPVYECYHPPIVPQMLPGCRSYIDTVH